MKGVILAAGKGKRLYPLTKGIPKVLLPVYDKPMIYYALDFMKEAGVREVMIVIAEGQEAIFTNALGDGAGFGVKITYRVQHEVNGTAGALIATKDFIEGEDILLYYGDNILLGPNLAELAREGIANTHENCASMFALEVANPSDYGVLEISKDGVIISLEEKPDVPKSNFIAPGIYFYPENLTSKLDSVELSPRGEYEMTDVNNDYLKENALRAIILPKETLWFDAVNFEGLLDASNIVRDFKKNKL